MVQNMTLRESERIRSYSGPYFPAFRLNTERHSVSLRTQSECGKIWTRITSNTDSFYAVRILAFGIIFVNWRYFFILSIGWTGCRATWAESKIDISLLSYVKVSTEMMSDAADLSLSLLRDEMIYETLFTRFNVITPAVIFILLSLLLLFVYLFPVFFFVFVLFFEKKNIVINVHKQSPRGVLWKWWS